MKSIRDNMPEPLKYPAVPIFHKKLIKNKGITEISNCLQKENR